MNFVSSLSDFGGRIVSVFLLNINARKLVRVLPVLILLVIGVYLRAYNISEFRTMVPDEFSWMLMGTSLLSEGVPQSWTIFPHKYSLVSKGCHLVAVPFLGHPPLFALVIGVWAGIVGQTDWCSISLGLIRWPMIAISFFSMLFTFLLTRSLFGHKLALLSLLAYVFFPSSILVSRVIAAEHFIGLLTLIALYLYRLNESRGVKNGNRLLIALMALVAFAAPLAKLTGMLVPGTMFLLSILQRRLKLAVMFALSGVFSFAAYLVYGWYYNWEVFVSIMEFHVGRPQSAHNFWTIFTRLDVGHYRFFDPSVILGLIGLFLIINFYRDRSSSKYIFAILFASSFLLVYLAPTQFYGWYRYFIYPFLAMGLGFSFLRLIEGDNSFLVFLIPLLISVLVSSRIVVGQENLRLVTFILFSLVGISFVFNNKWLPMKAVSAALIIVLFIANITFVSGVINYSWVAW